MGGGRGEGGEVVELGDGIGGGLVWLVKTVGI